MSALRLLHWRGTAPQAPAVRADATAFERSHGGRRSPSRPRRHLKQHQVLADTGLSAVERRPRKGGSLLACQRPASALRFGLEPRSGVHKADPNRVSVTSCTSPPPRAEDRGQPSGVFRHQGRRARLQRAGCGRKRAKGTPQSACGGPRPHGGGARRRQGRNPWCARPRKPELGSKRRFKGRTAVVRPVWARLIRTAVSEPPHRGRDFRWRRWPQADGLLWKASRRKQASPSAQMSDDYGPVEPSNHLAAVKLPIGSVPGFRVRAVLHVLLPSCFLP